MPGTVKCPQCGFEINFVPELIGLPVLCPNCRQKFPMMAPAAPPPTTAAAPAPVIIHNYVSPTINTASHATAAARSDARATAVAGSPAGCIGCALFVVLLSLACGGCLMMMSAGVDDQIPPAKPSEPRVVKPTSEPKVEITVQSPEEQASPQSKEEPSPLKEFLGTPTPQRDLHVWTSADGKFSAEAEFVSLTAGVAKLRKRDGAIVEVELNRLSESDQQYIRKGQYKRGP